MTPSEGAPTKCGRGSLGAGLNLQPPAPPVEYPGWARRDPWTVGPLSPRDASLGDDAWGSANGEFLSVLMRRMHTPLASRWVHIALRDALLASFTRRRTFNPIDWAAERAWLLLRLGEADAARMLVAGVDTDRFTPKMVQVGGPDRAGQLPIPPRCARWRTASSRLIRASYGWCRRCAPRLPVQPDQASAMIDQARRYGRIGGVDLALAEKVVGAGANGRASTIEWDPVDSLTAGASGLLRGPEWLPPDRLMNASPTAAACVRGPSAAADAATAARLRRMIAAGLGVFSSQTMVDLYSSSTT